MGGLTNKKEVNMFDNAQIDIIVARLVHLAEVHEAKGMYLDAARYYDAAADALEV